MYAVRLIFVEVRYKYVLFDVSLSVQLIYFFFKFDVYV